MRPTKKTRIIAINLFLRRVVVLLVTALAMSLDLASKSLVKQWLPLGASIPLIPGKLHFTYMQNPGVAFSMFAQFPQIMTIVGCVLLLAFLTYMLTRPQMEPIEMLGFSCILGGAAGNLYERLFFGSVTDFIDVRLIHFAIFNLADSFVFIGIVLLIFHTLQASHDVPAGS